MLPRSDKSGQRVHTLHRGETLVIRATRRGRVVLSPGVEIVSPETLNSTCNEPAEADKLASDEVTTESCR